MNRWESMQYNDEIIGEVLHRTNIVDLIGQDVRLRRSGADYTGLCPFHLEKTPSFHVSGAKQLYYCFGCHAGGNAFTYMMEYHNYSFSEALQYLAEKAGVSLPEVRMSEAEREAAKKKDLLLEVHKKAAGFYYYRLKQPAGEHGLRYLRERGLTDETIRKFGLGYADQFGSSLYRYLKNESYSDAILEESGLFRFDEKRGVSDRFWNRVMFPITDTRGRVIGFGGRVMGEGNPKYLNSPESYLFNKRKNLYALHYARSTRRSCLLLCEGYMDVISMHQAGFDNAVASLGTALTEEQCTLLKRFTSEVLLLYDSDGAGVGAALRAIPLLKDAGITPRVVDLSPHKDPDEFIRAEGAEAMEERLRLAENAFLFEIRQLEKNYRRSDPAEWTEFQRETARRLLAFPEEMERENYLEALCGRYGFDRQKMRRLIGRVAEEGPHAARYERPKSGEKTDRREDGMVTTQKLMLTYLANFPEAAEETRDLIGPEDFRDPFCKEVAEILYRQIGNGRVSEAELIASFKESEDERRAAGIFHTTIPVKSQGELDRAFTDTVMKLLREGNDARLKEADITDMSVFAEYIDRKKKLEEFERGKLIHLPYE